MSDASSSHLSPLWSWQALSEHLTDKASAGPDVTGIAIDSRKVKPGELFIALPGDPGPRFNPSYRSTIDGHDYVANAAAAGAAGALVHKSADAMDVAAGFPLLNVADTYDSLWALGHFARHRLTGDVLAVTGSSGKTTAKMFLQSALTAYAPPGSLNNHIGVPLSLANAPASCEAAIFEIGTNHPGEIGPLAEMVDADLPILLNVHTAHIENFENRAALVKEKTCIFNGLTNKSNAISEDELLLDFGRTFGYSRDADARLTGIKGDIASIDLCGKPVRARVPGGGEHRAKTVAMTLLAVHMLGRDLAPACELPVEIVPPGRGNILAIGDYVLVDDSYNANPQSMRAALDSFAQLSGPTRRIAVIGEMLELGESGAEAHLSLADHLQNMDMVYCVGAATHPLATAIDAPWCEQADSQLRGAILADLTPNSAIFVKGSNRVFWAQGFVDALSVELSLLT